MYNSLVSETQNPYEPSSEIAAETPNATSFSRSDQTARGCFGALGMLAGIASLLISAAVTFDGRIQSGGLLVILIMTTLGMTTLFGGIYLVRRAIHPPRIDE